jgi:hypothetical protein
MGFSVAQPRDAVLREDVEAQACEDDADCQAQARRVLSEQRREEARVEAAYQAKPAWEKMLGWLAIPTACWALWNFAGRRPNQQERFMGREGDVK